MDTSAQIISDLQQKIGPHQPVDFLSSWKGVPVMIRGHIQEIRQDTILFRLEPPDSICFARDSHALILHDIFIMGIQASICAYDPKEGVAELGEFIYVDRGFGFRSMVRVEPDVPIPAELILEKKSLHCKVVDLSLNGFGLITKSNQGLEAAKGMTVRIKMNLSDQDIEIPGTLLNIFPNEDSFRLAMSFSQDAPNHAVVTHYITHRRVEIRQEILSAYQLAVG